MFFGTQCTVDTTILADVTNLLYGGINVHMVHVT